MSRCFITATGTGIGKTLVTCALAYQLKQTALAIKPVISSFDENHPEQSDTGQLLVAQALPLSSIAEISPWRFKAPLSPDMAAKDESREIDFDKLIAFCRAKEDERMLLVEGVGGVMVPLNERHTVLDWMMALNYPVILVAGSYLGSLNHTLLSTKAIIAAGLRLQTVIVSESENSGVDLARTAESLRTHLPPHTPIHTIARLDSRPDLWKYVPDLTNVVQRKK